MTVSRPCDECGKVKRCRMYKCSGYECEVINYLCGPCARVLGYTMTNTSTEQAPEA